MTEVVGPRKARAVPSVAARAPRSVQRRGPAERAAGRFDHHRSGPIQRTPLGHDAAPPVDSVDGTVRGPGSPLPTNVRQVMEAGFGHRFENVRIHTDDEADRSARAYGALAYTVGGHIAFQAGSFDPSSTSGQRLIAHELTHVLQQRGSPGSASAQADPAISRPEDASEREADRVARGVVRSLGTPRASVAPAASISRTPAPRVQRQPQPGLQQGTPVGGGRQGSGAPPVNLADEAVAYLENMARFIEGLRIANRSRPGPDGGGSPANISGPEPGPDRPPAGAGPVDIRDPVRAPSARRYPPDPTPTGVSARARRTPAGVGSRLENSEGMDAATRDSERLQTPPEPGCLDQSRPDDKSGLAGTALGADDVALAQLHEQSLEAYLNGLVATSRMRTSRKPRRTTSSNASGTACGGHSSPSGPVRPARSTCGPSRIHGSPTCIGA